MLYPIDLRSRARDSRDSSPVIAVTGLPHAGLADSAVEGFPHQSDAFRLRRRGLDLTSFRSRGTGAMVRRGLEANALPMLLATLGDFLQISGELPAD